MHMRSSFVNIECFWKKEILDHIGCFHPEISAHQAHAGFWNKQPLLSGTHIASSVMLSFQGSISKRASQLQNECPLQYFQHGNAAKHIGKLFFSYSHICEFRLGNLSQDCLNFVLQQPQMHDTLHQGKKEQCVTVDEHHTHFLSRRINKLSSSKQVAKYHKYNFTVT